MKQSMQTTGKGSSAICLYQQTDIRSEASRLMREYHVGNQAVVQEKINRRILSTSFPARHGPEVFV